jgi:type III pantothenate kinase
MIINVNLIVEQGNTNLKAAVFDKDKIVASLSGKTGDFALVMELIDNYHPAKGIISSVVDIDNEVIAELKVQISKLILLDENTLVPIKIEYATPATLGKDRLAAVVGANYLKPERNLLVIDAGTAITYELIDSEGRYKGGNISPGLTTRFRALNHFTGKLPLVKESEEVVPFIGTSTETAIISGVVNGIIFEMDGTIDALKSEYDDIFVFLTGGHSFYFESRLKNHTFADANLVLIGLNRILEYNAE